MPEPARSRYTESDKYCKCRLQLPQSRKFSDNLNRKAHVGCGGQTYGNNLYKFNETFNYLLRVNVGRQNSYEKLVNRVSWSQMHKSEREGFG